jgi:hypothetical protein
MARKGQRRKAVRLRIDAKLLPQLADESLFGGFPDLNLAARKLPEAGHGLARGTLGQQDAAVSIDEGDSRNQEQWLWGLVGHDR